MNDQQDHIPWFDDEDIDFWRRNPDGVEEIDESFASYSLVVDYPTVGSSVYNEDIDSIHDRLYHDLPVFYY